MKLVKFFLIFIVGFFFSNLQAEEICFIAMNAKTGEIIAKKGGTCGARISPCSTFKIPLSLMGYDSGILKDETHPVLSFKEGYPDYIEGWREPHHPQLWMKNSCVWYSQVLTKQLGMNGFKDYVEKFHYGNQDISGDKGKNNGLTNAWLSSSLKISPQEQLVFLRKLVNRELPISPHAYAMTEKLLLLEELEGGWTFYGKTGTGAELKTDGTEDMNKQLGWLVGWIQKEEQITVFAFNIQGVKEVPSRQERYIIAKEFLKEFGLLTT